MADDADPPRKFYQLKTRPFEVLNPPSSARPMLTGVPPPPAGIDVAEMYQQASIPGPALPANHPPIRKNDVHVILEDNLQRANAAGLNDLAYRPRRRSRRRRDFFAVVIPLNAFFAFAAFGPYSNAALMAYGVAGIIISTLGLAWIMFAVMDDY